MSTDTKTYEIVAIEEKCAGCLMCQMRCSYRFTKTFNPSRSEIDILRQPQGKKEFSVIFREGCDQCGLCVIHCTYRALSRRELS